MDDILDEIKKDIDSEKETRRSLITIVLSYLLFTFSLIILIFNPTPNPNPFFNNTFDDIGLILLIAAITTNWTSVYFIRKSFKQKEKDSDFRKISITLNIPPVFMQAYLLFIILFDLVNN